MLKMAGPPALHGKRGIIQRFAAIEDSRVSPCCDREKRTLPDPNARVTWQLASVGARGQMALCGSIAVSAR